MLVRVRVCGDNQERAHRRRQVQDPVILPVRTVPDGLPPALSTGASVVVAVSAEGLHGGRAGAGPLRHGAAGRAPGGVPV
jgi:hypothetical protein